MNNGTLYTRLFLASFTQQYAMKIAPQQYIKIFVTPFSSYLLLYYMRHNLFNQSPTDGRLSCFKYFTTTNILTMNIHALCICCLVFLPVYFWDRFLDF